MFPPKHMGAHALCALALVCAVAALSQRFIAAQTPSSLIAFHSDRDGDWEIFVMNGDGSGLRQLTTNTVEDRDPVWSPDGTTVAFVSRRDGNIEIYSVRADGTGLRRVTNHAATDFLPSFSPDGRQLAFATDRDRQTDIYLVNADGTNLRRFTDDAADDWRPVWSPDGKEIAFLSGRDGGQSDGSGEVYLRASDGTSAARRLLKAARRVLHFSWSPDSSRLALFSTGSRKFEVLVADRMGVAETNLSAVSSSAMDSEAVWSPDGKRLAFLGGMTQGPRLVMVMNADGSSRRAVSTPEIPVTGPLSWSPDGRSILYTAMVGGNWEAVVAGVSGDAVRRLTDSTASDQSATWSPRLPARVVLRSH